MRLPEGVKRALIYIKKYQYVLLLLLVGVLLLAWPVREEAESGQTGLPAAQATDFFQVREMEEKLEKALSQIEGAGEVTVVLTVKESPRQVLAQDGKAVEGSGQTSRETSTVLVLKGSGVQEPVTLTQLGPTYQGALVVARGGDDPRVRLAISEAVSALTGLGADKISICKGK